MPPARRALGDGRVIDRQLARDRLRRRVRRQRAIAAAASLIVLSSAGGACALLISSGGGHPAGRSSAAPRPPQLPRGGRVLLPAYRVVAYYGAPQDPGLGELGIGTPQRATGELLAQAAPYALPRRPVMPAFELIATLVTAAPGTDGRYRYRQSDATIRRYLDAARAARALLILDIQPGRSPFMTEVRAYRSYLEQPDVGLALDPEWSMRPGQLPGKVIGSTRAATVNQVSAYLASVVHEHNLPQKLMIVHQFTPGMIEHKRGIVPRAGVALVININGFGDPPNKISKYRLFTP
ncbi:MAG: hypothetical protein ACXVYV_09285, partial [Gaiellales bacterium]